MQSQIETTFENNTDIKQFLNCTSPTIDMVVKAYIARDTYLKVSFEDYKLSCLKKLGYTTETITTNIQYKFKVKMNEIIDKFLLNTLESPQCNFTSEYDKLVNSDEMVTYIETHETRFTELDSIDNNVDFYKKLTYEELMCLGW